jgi:hypothetical protein
LRFAARGLRIAWQRLRIAWQALRNIRPALPGIRCRFLNHTSPGPVHPNGAKARIPLPDTKVSGKSSPACTNNPNPRQAQTQPAKSLPTNPLGRRAPSA